MCFFFLKDGKKFVANFIRRENKNHGPAFKGKKLGPKTLQIEVQYPTLTTTTSSRKEKKRKTH